MKLWNENKMECWTRLTLLMINIILTFVFRGNKFVIGYTYGVNLVIILESVVSIIVRNHNHKVILKPLKKLEKDMKQAFEELDKLFYDKEK